MRRLLSPALAIPIFFFLAGLAFIPKAGIHYDASYELGCFYSCVTPAFRPVILGTPVPVMVLPYLGAFKAWLYWPILHYLDLTAFILRVPLLLIGTISVWLSFRILDRISGRPAAIAGSLLLATDAMFLIVTSYDFGPVVFLHCFLLAGILLLLRFERTGSSKHLALAFFLFGLALWHKALFIWMLNGVVLGALIVFPRRIRTLLSPLRIGVAIVSFSVGALPLVCYNIATGGATIHTEKVMSGEAPLPQKALLLSRTISGQLLFGWLTDETNPDTVIAPHGSIGRVSVALNRIAGGPRSNWMLYAFVVSCCLVPWLWFTPSRRPILFVLIFLVITWVQMVLMPNTGATVHHAILLWPFPQFLIAIAGAQLAQSLGKHGVRLMPVVLAAMAAQNFLVVNHYYADLITRGTTVIWTDAIYPLSSYLDSLSGRNVITVDWGYATTLCLLSDGERPQHDITYLLLNPSEKESAWVRTLMEDPKSVFVDHTAESQQFPISRGHVASIAAQAGRRKEILAIITDRNRRPRFEVVRYVAIEPRP